MRTLTYKGETLNLRGWEKRLGLNPGTITARLRAGMPLEMVLSPGKHKRGPKNKRPLVLTFDGETLGLEEWADRIGFKAGTILARLKRGLPMEQVLSPRHLGNGIPKCRCPMVKDGQEKSMTQCAQELGITISAMSRRVSRGKKDVFSPKYHREKDPSRQMPEYRKWQGTRAAGATWSWEEFMSEVGIQPSKTSILARRDPAKPWGPGNAEWITTTAGRTSPAARLLRYKGEVMSTRAWARRCGLCTLVLRGRLLRGWSVEKALTTPPLKPGPRRGSRKKRHQYKFTGPCVKGRP